MIPPGGESWGGAYSGQRKNKSKRDWGDPTGGGGYIRDALRANTLQNFLMLPDEQTPMPACAAQS